MRSYILFAGFLILALLAIPVRAQAYYQYLNEKGEVCAVGAGRNRVRETCRAPKDADEVAKVRREMAADQVKRQEHIRIDACNFSMLETWEGSVGRLKKEKVAAEDEVKWVREELRWAAYDAHNGALPSETRRAGMLMVESYKPIYQEAQKKVAQLEWCIPHAVQKAAEKASAR